MLTARDRGVLLSLSMLIDYRPAMLKCPAGEQCQAWLFHAQSGNYENAWKQIIEDNPFPAVMGRVCYHTCQGACNRNGIDEPVGINAVERFLGDYALEKIGNCRFLQQIPAGAF